MKWRERSQLRVRRPSSRLTTSSPTMSFIRRKKDPNRLQPIICRRQMSGVSCRSSMQMTTRRTHLSRPCWLRASPTRKRGARRFSPVQTACSRTTSWVSSQCELAFCRIPSNDQHRSSLRCTKRRVGSVRGSTRGACSRCERNAYGIRHFQVATLANRDT